MSKRDYIFFTVVILFLVIDCVVRFRSPVVRTYLNVCRDLSSRVDSRLDYVERRIFTDIVPYLTNDVSAAVFPSNVISNSAAVFSSSSNGYDTVVLNSFYRHGSISLRGETCDFFVLDGIRYGRDVYHRFYHGEQILDIYPDCFSTERAFYICSNVSTNANGGLR